MDDLNIDEIHIEDSLMRSISHLAVRHWGDASEASVLRETEIALELMLVWLDRVEGGEKEIDEPIYRFRNGERTPLWNGFWGNI